MTIPRQVLPGTTYLVTRRCAQRQYLLRPSRTTNQIFLYLLTVAARRYGVDVHAYCVLSNHYHLVVTDRAARLPAFQQFLDALVARALNASLGRWEAFWAPASYSAVALGDARAIVDKAAYALANPVAAGLVRKARQWPGLWSSPDDDRSGAILATRPDRFFDPEGAMPQTLELTLTAPPGFASAQAFRDQLAAALAERETAAGRPSRTFVGAKRVLEQRPFSRPKVPSPRRRLSPKVAATSAWRRFEMLLGLKAFRDSYCGALCAWRDGDREARFPWGTYLMRVAHGVACAGTG